MKHRHNEYVTVKAVHYTKDEEFWLGYQCKKCGLRFENIQLANSHSKIHKSKGVCPICKNYEILEKHHYSYKDFLKDKQKNTLDLCNHCHGMQQRIQDLIRKGIEIIYIGHILS